MDENQDKIVINELKPFDKQVDDVLSGTDITSSHLEVLKITPPILRMVGVPNLPILMTARHVRTITQEDGADSANYHGLGVELVKHLPELISDPVMIMDSISPDAKAQNSIVIVTQMVDNKNRPVIGAIKLNGFGRQNSKIISANILTSAYGKDNFQSFIERNIKQGSVLYVDKEKSQALSVNPGIQFPDVMASLSFNTIIRKTNAFVNSDKQKSSEKSKRSPLLINLFAGPSAGKTTAALELTAALKKKGFNVEYVSEYAKELVLENKTELLKNQVHVTDEQFHRLDRLRNSGVEIIVTDSPVLLGKVYGEGKISREYPVILDIWKRGRDFINSNGIVYGKSGSGKSFFAKLLITMIYSENSRIFILDPENEYQVLAKNLDGLFIDIGSATQGRINPLHVYPVLTDEGDVAPPEVVFNAHLQFLEDFFKITLKGIAQDAFEELNNLIKLTYESVGIKHDTDCTDFKPEQYPTFDTLKAIVEKEMRRTDLTPMRKANLERVNTYVQKFATGGMYSSLWNGPSTLEVDSRFVVFNFQSLFGAKNQTVANAQILVVMRYLDMQIINIRELNRNGYGDVVHPFIVLDEGYNFIDADYPVALQFAYLWYKRIRKYEGSIFFLTQNLSDIFGNEKVIQKTSAIVNNSQYSFVFGLAPAELEILTDLYKNVGGLNPTERAFISDAGNGDCFAICSARQRTRFHVEAHDTVRAIFENIGKPWEESE